jgi:hypothetical protein
LESNIGTFVNRFKTRGLKPPQDKGNLSALQLAKENFEETTKYSWPSRDPKSVRESFEVHVRKFDSLVQTSIDYEDSKKEVIGALPKFTLNKVWYEINDKLPYEETLEQLKTVCYDCSHLVKGTASPGFPWTRMGYFTKKHVLTEFRTLIVTLAAERLYALMNGITNSCVHPDEPVVDCIDLFIKGEFHSAAKIKENRLRLISSVSLVDEIVQRALLGPIVEGTIRAMYRAGVCLGFDKNTPEGLARLQNQWNFPSVSVDLVGYDWSQTGQHQEIKRDIYLEQAVNPPKVWTTAVTSLWKARELKVFALPDGDVYEATVPGIELSGQLITGDGNTKLTAVLQSKSRKELAKRIPFKWKPTSAFDPVNGDDAVKEVPDFPLLTQLSHPIDQLIASIFNDFGFEVTTRVNAPMTGVSFCSAIHHPGCYYPERLGKMLANFAFAYNPVGGFESYQERLVALSHEVKYLPNAAELMQKVETLFPSPPPF